MKTIRLIVLAALLLPALVSQAQTKEETIEWIKNYLGANGKSVLFKGNNEAKRYGDKITFDYSTKILLFKFKPVDNSTMYLYYSIDLSKCTSIKKGYLSSSFSDFVKYRITDDDGYKSSSDFDSNGILLELTENGDYAKLDKALKHLCELCGVKLMNEDLF